MGSHNTKHLTKAEINVRARIVLLYSPLQEKEKDSAF